MECIIEGDAVLAEKALERLRRVEDPEVGVNIVDLGLVYGIAAHPERLQVVMTLTSAACPLGDALTAEARHLLRTLVAPGGDVEVHLVWEPPWSPERMSGEARRELGWG